MKDYDSWLVRDYERAQVDEDQFAEWAELEGYDLDDPVQENEAYKAFDSYIQEMAEAYYEARAEAAVDRMLDWQEEKEWAGEGNW